MIHAIGDSANHTLLNIYEEVQRINGVKDRRSRIEHAQHLSIEDIPRFSHTTLLMMDAGLRNISATVLRQPMPLEVFWMLVPGLLLGLTGL